MIGLDAQHVYRELALVPLLLPDSLDKCSKPDALVTVIHILMNFLPCYLLRDVEVFYDIILHLQGIASLLHILDMTNVGITFSLS